VRRPAEQDDGAVDAVHLEQHGGNCRLAAFALLAPHFGPK